MVMSEEHEDDVILCNKVTAKTRIKSYINFMV